MCCTGRCVWENYMGDCGYPRHIKEITDVYGKYFCDATLNDYFTISKIKKTIKIVEQRKNKIKKIKNKLL